MYGDYEGGILERHHQKFSSCSETEDNTHRPQYYHVSSHGTWGDMVLPYPSGIPVDSVHNLKLDKHEGYFGSKVGIDMARTGGEGLINIHGVCHFKL